MSSVSPEHIALGRAIREMRTAREFTQQALAVEAGLDRTFIGGVERGERSPTYGSLVRIANALGVSVSEIVGLAERLTHE